MKVTRMKKPEKRVTGFTIHYDDGTMENVDKGLLAFMPDAGSVMIKVGSLDVPLFLTLLAGLEGAAEAYLTED